MQPDLVRQSSRRRAQVRAEPHLMPPPPAQDKAGRHPVAPHKTKAGKHASASHMNSSTATGMLFHEVMRHALTTRMGS
jgi:hypothetical protein